MTDWWDKHIQRADELVDRSSATNNLLKFYAQLLRSQKEIYKYLGNHEQWSASGELETDVFILRDALQPLLRVVQTQGSQQLATEAKNLSECNPELLITLLVQHWNSPSDDQFFGKACLQPYLKLLVDSGVQLRGQANAKSERRCPFCGGPPQVSFLHNTQTTAESGNRDLICANCLNSWEFRRVVFANCGEERPESLPYFHSSEFDHVRIEACDSCKHYIKGIDLTRLGHAVPLVDEVYAAPLDLWARNHGYEKIQLNLVGI